MDEYEMHGFIHEKSMLVGNPLFYEERTAIFLG